MLLRLHLAVSFLSSIAYHATLHGMVAAFICWSCHELYRLAEFFGPYVLWFIYFFWMHVHLSFPSTVIIIWFHWMHVLRLHISFMCSIIDSQMSSLPYLDSSEYSLIMYCSARIHWTHLMYWYMFRMHVLSVFPEGVVPCSFVSVWRQSNPFQLSSQQIKLFPVDRENKLKASSAVNPCLNVCHPQSSSNKQRFNICRTYMLSQVSQLASLSSCRLVSMVQISYGRAFSQQLITRSS